jgi:hypothetical protein
MTSGSGGHSQFRQPLAQRIDRHQRVRVLVSIYPDDNQRASLRRYRMLR